MMKFVPLLLLTGACFAPSGNTSTTGAGAVTTSSSTFGTGTGTSGAPVTDTYVPTSMDFVTTTTTTATGAIDTSSGTSTRPLNDLPPSPGCDVSPGKTWGPCLPRGMCDSDAECLLMNSGWVCVPSCIDVTQCIADDCRLSDQVLCDAGRCVPYCDAQEACAGASACDEATGARGWMSDCGPAPGGGAWEPCDPQGGCPADLYCVADDVTSVCVPGCPCATDAVVCGVDLGMPECGDADLCMLHCVSDADCAPGMRCGQAGACAWPAG